MTDIENFLQSAQQQCEKNGTKLTPKRKRILSILAESGVATSAYELIDLYSKAFGEKMQAMSMYRILDFLESEQLIHKLQLANKYITCTHISCDHGHELAQFLICNQCNTVREVPIQSSVVESIRQNVENADFALLNSQIELNCLCPACAN